LHPARTTTAYLHDQNGGVQWPITPQQEPAPTMPERNSPRLDAVVVTKSQASLRQALKLRSETDLSLSADLEAVLELIADDHLASDVDY
jgi:hypothetical protein